jgi:hypothetical protein
MLSDTISGQTNPHHFIGFSGFVSLKNGRVENVGGLRG